jgi:hypothetical protein
MLETLVDFTLIFLPAWQLIQYGTYVEINQPAGLPVPDTLL